MNITQENEFGAQFVELAKLLEQCPEVTRYDLGDEKEAWTLAHAFLDLSESFNVLMHNLFPKMQDPQLTPSQRFEVLTDIGEEFRHILYHIKDPQFYRYLQDGSDEPKAGGA